MTEPSSERVHASCVAIDGAAVLLSGVSGSGKSDLALRLIDRGAKLISDDYTLVRRSSGQLVASAPDLIGGKIEVRGLGIIELAAGEATPVRLMILLDQPVPRFPERQTRLIAGVELPALALGAFEVSTPIKVELALRRETG